MKASVQTSETFKPVTLTITLETKDELLTLFSLMNVNVYSLHSVATLQAYEASHLSISDFNRVIDPIWKQLYPLVK